jgi:rod shape-determining protein MreC
MNTSRDDFGIAIRSAFLDKGTKQKFSFFILVLLSIVLIFIETIESKPINFVRSFMKDTIYRGSVVVAAPVKTFKNINNFFSSHINLYKNYDLLKKENEKLKSNFNKSEFLELENSQLRVLIDEQISSVKNLVSARVMLDKQSPYLNSFIINMGGNKGIKNGMAVLDGDNFIGRIVDVNFFSSRVLLISDFNSKIPVLVEPSGSHAILSGHGNKKPTLEYLPENHKAQDSDKVYTSGKGGIFSPGMPIGEIKIQDNLIKVILFSNLKQITFVNVDLESKSK